jgi:hypothetical protein
MARYIAVDWDSKELRVVGGTPGSGSVQVDFLRAVPLSPDAASPETAVAEALAKLTAEGAIGKGDLLLTANRSSVELRSLQLPPADANELPDMVRFSAQSRFAQLGDQWPLDYLPLPSEGSTDQLVLAAAMQGPALTRLEKIASASNLPLKQVRLRPLASQALAELARGDLAGSSSLLIQRTGEELDLIVSQNGIVTLMRTARIADGQVDLAVKSLLGEIKRTRFAAESQEPKVAVDRLVLWGDLGLGQDLAATLRQETGLAVDSLGLSDAVTWKSGASVSTAGDDPERFVPAVGLLAQAAGTSSNSIDFLNPRRRIEVKRPLWHYIAAASAAALLGAIGLWAYLSRHRALDSEIARLQKASNEMNQTVELSRKYIRDWQKVEKFLQADTNILDEMVYISERSLPPEQMMFGDWAYTLNAATDVGTFSGPVTMVEPELMTDFEEKLRDERHIVSGKQVNETRDKKSMYRWIGTTTMAVQPKSVDEIDALLQKPPKPGKIAPSDRSQASPSDAAASGTSDGMVDSIVDENPQDTKPSMADPVPLASPGEKDSRAPSPTAPQQPLDAPSAPVQSPSEGAPPAPQQSSEAIPDAAPGPAAGPASGGAENPAEKAQPAPPALPDPAQPGEQGAAR